MEWTWLEDFLTLHRLRNFTRAAAARHTTQPAFSRRIQRLEDYLGARLFERDANPVSLTTAGEAFLPRAEALRADILDARRTVQNAATHLRHRQRIYTTNTLATTLLPQWIKQNAISHFSIIVASVTGCREALRRGQADRAILPVFDSDEEDAALTHQEITKDSISLVALPDVAPAITLRQRQLNGPIMLYTPGTFYGARISAMLAAKHITLAEEPVGESAAAESLLAQTLAGFGAAWIPDILGSKKLRRCLPTGQLDIRYKIMSLSVKSGIH